MQMIEVSKLTPHPRNNEFFDDITGDNWIEFKKSIETSGVIEPVIITQDKIIVSGHQRVRACKELNINEVPCEVKIYESDQQIIKDLLETNLRQRGIGNTNAIKLGRCIVELEKIYNIKEGRPEKQRDNLVVKTQEDLATDIGVSQRQLQDYKKLLTLIPELQQLIETDKLSPTVGYKVLSKLTKEDQQKLISDFGKDYISQLTQKKAEELIKNKENNTINTLKYDLSIKQKTIDDLSTQLTKKKRDIELLEQEVKLYEKDSKEYKNLKKQIEDLTKAKDNLGRQIESTVSLSGLVVHIEDFIKTKLAPVKYSRAILEMQYDDTVIKNLTEILEIVESWCDEMRRYLPNNNIINVTNMEVIDNE